MKHFSYTVVSRYKSCKCSTSLLLQIFLIFFIQEYFKSLWLHIFNMIETIDSLLKTNDDHNTMSFVVFAEYTPHS